MTLEERLTRLERMNRRLTLSLVLAGGMVATLVVLAVGGCTGPTAPPESITARQFVLVDAKGKRRATLGTTTDRAGLWVFDEGGKTRAMLGMFRDGPGLDLVDEGGKTRVGLALTKDGPSLTLFDEKGQNAAASLVVNPAGQPGLWLLGMKGEGTKGNACLAFNENGSPALSLHDKEGDATFFAHSIRIDGAGKKTSVLLTTALPDPKPLGGHVAGLPEAPLLWLHKGQSDVWLDPTSLCLWGQPGTNATLANDGLRLHDEKGNFRAGLCVTKSGWPFLSLDDENGKQRVCLSVGEAGGGSSLNIYNPLGKEVVTVQSCKTNSGLVIVSDHNGKPTDGLPRH
jgi:hypothetical protein